MCQTTRNKQNTTEKIPTNSQQPFLSNANGSGRAAIAKEEEPKTMQNLGREALPPFQRWRG